jgi:chemosensory pili system protein ChpC
MTTETQASAPAPSALYSLLVPLVQTRLIVPRDCVAEVVGWDPRRYGARDPDPAWLLGQLSWEGATVPVVSFEGLCGLAIELPAHRARVVVMRCLGREFAPRHFGIVTAGFPQLVRVSPDALVADDDHGWPDDAPVLCQLRMVGQSPVIPDLERVEQRLAALPEDAFPRG